LILHTNDLSMPIDVPSGIETARHYAAIRMELKLAGKQHAMPVMSRDSHFDFVGGLRRRTW
jgi:hypothetical protein